MAGRRSLISAEELVSRVCQGDQGAVSRALTRVTDESDGYEEIARSFFPFHGNSPTIGLCGSPGSGKSSLVNTLVSLLRKRGESVAILAVDPTSAYTGGAFLGDRIRVQQHALDEGVFFRSLATRGMVGGLNETIFSAIHVLEAYETEKKKKGFDWILIETVGTGQDEVDIADVVDTVVCVTAPYQGDEFQAMKAGTMEIADVFAVNKADLEEVDKAVASIKDALSLGLSHDEEAWSIPVHAVSARTGQGIDVLLESIEAHGKYLLDSGEIAVRRKRQLRKELSSLVSRLIRRNALERVTDCHIKALVEKKSDPLTLSRKILKGVS
ncbi:MAG: methylmalonyl Co-A mutase-associated GTPase MeaB [Elusimicrobia bacterium]|nr:MAG: methylmalonyl Co-A mutase-associated GTPase MeaB [Elusimicrobiota bacterium]